MWVRDKKRRTLSTRPSMWHLFDRMVYSSHEQPYSVFVAADGVKFMDTSMDTYSNVRLEFSDRLPTSGGVCGKCIGIWEGGTT